MSSGSESDFEPYIDTRGLSSARISPPRTPVSVKVSSCQEENDEEDNSMNKFKSLEIGMQKMSELQAQINELRSRFRSETETVQHVSNSISFEREHHADFHETTEVKRARMHTPEPDSEQELPVDEPSDAEFDDDLATEIRLLEELRIDLREREETVSKREKEIADESSAKHADLTSREDALEARAEELDQREEDLAAREDELAAREKEVEEAPESTREAELEEELAAKTRMANGLEEELKEQNETFMKIVADTEDFMQRYKGMETSFKSRIREIEAERDELKERLADAAADTRLDALQQKHDEVLRAFSAQRTQMKENDRAHDAAMADLIAEVDRLVKEREAAKQRPSELDGADFKELLLTASQTEETLKATAQELEDTRAQLKASQAREEAAQKEMSADRTRGELRAIVSSQQAQIADLVAETNEFRKRISSSTVEIKQLQAELDTARKITVSLTRNEQTSLARLDDGTDIAKSLRAQLAERDGRVSEMERLVRDTRQKAETISRSVLDELFEARDEAARLKAANMELTNQVSGLKQRIAEDIGLDERMSLAEVSTVYPQTRDDSPVQSTIAQSEATDAPRRVPPVIHGIVEKPRPQNPSQPRGYVDSPVPPPREPLESTKLVARTGPSLFSQLAAGAESPLSASLMSNASSFDRHARRSPKISRDADKFMPDESVLDYIKRRKEAILGGTRRTPKGSGRRM
ncbi:chromosome segregation protein [Carpediemonas membranifera]|uniref:Chromosome segregation protein n=1 Tax=Carpediemonas membranifera TaxID=201153 RepID=A0A8J6APU8_9EUKA|nr:chromosome segregation protein [Carpediemonas membranifera]|eukprot:KAG9390028.1 chromosome segregation protein [Carpediemonas membranifera]